MINEEAEEIAMQCIEDINHKLAYGLSKDTAKLFSFSLVITLINMIWV